MTSPRTFGTDDRTPFLAPAPRWRHWSANARRIWAEQREAHERLLIMNRPWTHDQLHWVPTVDGHLELHGRVAPPRRSQGPVTRGGWCPCQAAEHRRERIAELLALSPGE